MTIESVRDVLLWSTLTNYGVILLWFAVFSLGHD